jgi:hypothetical protein
MYIVTPPKVVLGIDECLVLGVASISIWIIGSILHTLNTFKKSLPAILGGAVLFGIFFVSYLVAKPVPMAKFPDISDMLNKVVSGGLITVYILGVAAIFIAIYAEIIALIKS